LPIYIAFHLKKNIKAFLARFTQRPYFINIVKVLNYTFNKILGPFIKPHSAAQFSESLQVARVKFGQGEKATSYKGTKDEREGESHDFSPLIGPIYRPAPLSLLGQRF
jgi:hypothetical protein